MITAALFEGTTAILILKGTAKQLNANTRPTRVWREIPADIELVIDVPPLADLPVHPLHVQRT